MTSSQLLHKGYLLIAFPPRCTEITSLQKIFIMFVLVCLLGSNPDVSKEGCFYADVVSRVRNPSFIFFSFGPKERKLENEEVQACRDLLFIYSVKNTSINGNQIKSKWEEKTMYEPKDKNFDLRIADAGLVKDFYRLEEIDKTKMVVEGFWRGRHFVIGKNRFCVPVVYVQWRGKNPPGDEYFGDAYWLPEDKRDDTMYYGWDHGHAWDWLPTDFSPFHRWHIPDEKEYAKEHHKWTIPEMLMEIAEFIECYRSYETCQEEDAIERDLE